MRRAVFLRSLFIAVGGAHDALAGLVLAAAFQGIETGCLTIFAPGGTRMLAVVGRRQRTAHPRTDPPHDFAAAGAAFAERRFLGTFARWLIPAHTIFAGVPIPCDRAVSGGGGVARKQGIAEGQQGDDERFRKEMDALKEKVKGLPGYR